MNWTSQVEEKFTGWIESPKILGGDKPSDYQPMHHFVWSLVEHGITPDYFALRAEMMERLENRFMEHKLEHIVYTGAAQVELLLWFVGSHPLGPTTVREALKYMDRQRMGENGMPSTALAYSGIS